MKMKYAVAVAAAISVNCAWSADADQAPVERPGILSITFNNGAKYLHEYTPSAELSAYQILGVYNMPATVYVPTDKVGETAEDPFNTYMDWTDLADLVAAKWAICTEGKSNTNFPKLINGLDDDYYLRDELIYSSLYVKKHLGFKPDCVASPYDDVTQKTLDVIKSVADIDGKPIYASNAVGRLVVGPKGTLVPVSHPGFNSVWDVNPFQISRLRVTGNSLPQEVCDFINRAANNHEWLVLEIETLVSNMDEDFRDVAKIPHVASIEDFQVIAECAANAQHGKHLLVLTVPEALKVIYPDGYHPFPDKGPW
jgi:hypothetical protein